MKDCSTTRGSRTQTNVQSLYLLSDSFTADDAANEHRFHLAGRHVLAAPEKCEEFPSSHERLGVGKLDTTTIEQTRKSLWSSYCRGTRAEGESSSHNPFIVSAIGNSISNPYPVMAKIMPANVTSA